MENTVECCTPYTEFFNRGVVATLGCQLSSNQKFPEPVDQRATAILKQLCRTNPMSPLLTYCFSEIPENASEECTVLGGVFYEMLGVLSEYPTREYTYRITFLVGISEYIHLMRVSNLGEPFVCAYSQWHTRKAQALQNFLISLISRRSATGIALPSPDRILAVIERDQNTFAFKLQGALEKMQKQAFKRRCLENFIQRTDVIIKASNLLC